MDKRTQTDQLILKRAIDAIERHGIKATIDRWEPTLGRHRPDALINLVFGTQEFLYPVEIKKNITWQALGAIRAQLQQMGNNTVLVTDYVNPRIADQLKEANVQFFDTAGNANLNQPPLLVWVRGQKRPQEFYPAPAGRAFEPTGLRVIFALLCQPKLITAPYREVAAAVKVAHGTVGWVMPDLIDQGFMTKPKDGRNRTLLKKEILLQQWAEAFARRLRPKLQIGRFRTGEPDLLTKTTWTLNGAQIGGEIAGGQLTNYLKPGTATFYADDLDPGFVIENRLIKDQKGNIEILRRFWDNEALGMAHGDFVPLPLVYADLIAIGDARTIEIARLVHARITN